MGGEFLGIGAQPVGAAAGRFDQSGHRQAGQGHAGAALAHAEQRAGDHRVARRQRLAVGAQEQVQDEVTGIGCHRSPDITDERSLRQYL